MVAKKFRAPAELFSKKPQRSIFSAHFQIRSFPNSCGHNRFAAAVGIKAEKSSVRRHFWKRLILDSLAKENNFGKDFVVIAKAGLRGILKEEAKKEIKEIFSKANQ